MRKLLWSFSDAGMKLVYLIFCNDMFLNDKTKHYNVLSTDREVLRPSMGLNIVSVSVILHEKLQCMYNFNRFDAFMTFPSHN